MKNKWVARITALSFGALTLSLLFWPVIALMADVALREP